MIFYEEPVGEEEVIRKNMELADRKNFTAADVDALPEEERAEIIDGQIFLFASPRVVHQRLVMKIGSKLDVYIAGKGGSCQVFAAPLDVYLNNDSRTRVEPDIFVVCDPSKIHEDACYGAPDLVIEVVSQSTKRRDFGLKVLKYRTAGVREYWIVDPYQRNVTVYWFEDESENCQYTFEEAVVFHSFPGLTLCVRELLGENA